MIHVVLLGDSIFDNARYVPGGPAVVEQVRVALPADGRATLLAQDGATTEDVPRQLRGLPPDATHLVLSVGGNDALSEAATLRELAATVGDALGVMDGVLGRFEAAYRGLLRAVGGVGLPAVVCTVYDRVPGLESADRAALRGFNEAILRAAAEAGLPVIDLRLVCPAAGDYSAVSPIEPSVQGGRKIADRVAAVVAGHDFAAGRCVLFR